ncbi:hypothetical protein A5892_04750 [Halotalea alkalilenta]|uniref:DUF2782 domain-containing protein n=1 Tax=Halotalea alkalilenta TaxID=376489 RepID=A0A172YJU6_9GAMM|nr:hypothetical protein A5892_04750 [Halotalea alkalilenta]
MSALFALPLALPMIGIETIAQAQAQDQQQDAPAPDITTRQEDDRTVREYRVNGQLYAIEVVPNVGPSYFLVDSNGDGNFQRSPNNTQRIAIPQWTLLRW